MKINSFASILITSFLLFSIASNAQQVEPAKSGKVPAVTKGYYSIGNHAEKIPSGSRIPADTLTIPVVTKGFYSIEDNTKKLPKRQTWLRMSNPRPVISKGYYSIGDHWKRLPQSNKQ
jgi:hypothetical protein